MKLKEHAYTLTMTIRDSDGNVIASKQRQFPYWGAGWVLRPFRDGVRWMCQSTGYELGTEFMMAIGYVRREDGVWVYTDDNRALEVDRAA
jgi:hypothetical protein